MVLKPVIASFLETPSAIFPKNLSTLLQKECSSSATANEDDSNNISNNNFTNISNFMNFKTNDYSPNLNYYLNISIIQILNYKITVFKIIILITILLLLIKPKYI